MHVACCIADELHNKNGCVIVHGADGTDNTLLITSLVKLLLNPEYRTLKGFQQLIEIEWLLGGHPFSKRYFKSAYGSTNSKQEGPVFVLFLDCVRQLLDQFCLSFEFNQDYLILLFDNVYASQYGTFLGTCQRDREDLFAKTRTISLWSALDIVNDDKYLNPVYERNNNVIWPSLHYNSLTIWCKLFLRYQRNELPFVEEKNEIKKLCQANSQARLKVEKLRK
jgi:myotubularin-related protein 9